MPDVTVVSVLPGTFYRSPAPGEKPFVEPGHAVSADTVIGIVELMKQFNEVTAGAAGVLREFCVDDGDAVDVDVALAIVESGGA